MSFRPAYQPNYSLLTAGSFRGVIDATGLRTGVANGYGTVNSADSISGVNGIAPGPVIGFADNGVTGGIVRRVSVNGISVIEMQGTRWLRSTAAASTWDFFSHPFASIRWTVTILMRCGFGDNPGDLKGFLGTNGSSTAQKGFAIWSEDRDTIQSNSISHNITKGTAGAISTSGNADQMVPNTWDVWRFTFDSSLAAADRFKAYRNGSQVTTTVSSASTVTVATPTNTLEIGNVGGGSAVFPFVGQMSHVIIQNVVELTATADAFEATLQPIRVALSNFDNTYSHPYNFVQGDGTRYFIGINQAVDPTTPGKIMRVHREGDSHLADASSQTKWSLSIDYGLTFTTPAVIIVPPGSEIMGGMVAGYSSTGRFWIVCEYRTVGGAGEEPFSTHALYTDDDGANWTESDITASGPSDGLPRWSFYGSMLETSTGRLAFSFYKWNSGFASSANYLMVTDDDGATWTFKTVRAPAASYLNEMATVIAGTRGIIYIRNDVTKEWTCYSSTDNLDTFSNDGDVSLGEAITNASPGIFSKFQLYGVGVIAFWYPVRDVPESFKVVFGKESTLEATPTAMDLDTKVTLRARIVHYGMMCHPYGDLYSVGGFAEDPVVNPYLNENRMISLFGGVYWKSNILEQLGIAKVNL